MGLPSAPSFASFRAFLRSPQEAKLRDATADGEKRKMQRARLVGSVSTLSPTKCFWAALDEKFIRVTIAIERNTRGELREQPTYIDVRRVFPRDNDYLAPGQILRIGERAS